LENTGDEGSSKVRPPYVVTPLEGLRQAGARLGIADILTGDETDLSAARAACGAADAVIVVVGNTAEDEGEFIPGDIALGADIPSDLVSEHKSSTRGGDRDNLGLRADQQALIAAAAEEGKPVVVVIVSGSAVLVDPWHQTVGAVVQTFYSGMEGGTALARLLFGEISPSGKLPFTVAKSAADYPFFDKNAQRITYDLWHGYSWFDREGIEPRYPFGHGLSYARFGYRALKVRKGREGIAIEVTVFNEGGVTAEEVVQAYVGTPGKAAERQEKLLRAFKRIRLAPAERQVVTLEVPYRDLRYRDPASHSWRLEPGEYRVMCGTSSTSTSGTSIVL